MLPEYAEKFSALALRDYLSASPLSAAVVVQSSWAVRLGEKLTVLLMGDDGRYDKILHTWDDQSQFDKPNF